jgi:hypothetical protein
MAFFLPANFRANIFNPSTIIMKKNLLKYRKPEILDGLFCGIGESLDIRFQEQELGQVNTFGELCDLVYSKLPLEKIALCTTQQSFYRLRSEIARFQQLDTEAITPGSRLEYLFPCAGRRRTIRQFHKHSGLSVLYLRPAKWIITVLMVILGAATVTLFFFPMLAATGFAIGLSGFLIATFSGTAFAYETVGEAAHAMAQEQYSVWRNNPNTVNHMEVESLIRKAFCEQFAFEPTMLTREAHF